MSFVASAKLFYRKMTFPLPQDQSTQGFVPNYFIRWLRFISKLIIFILRIDGENRFSNEFIQMLDPKISVKLPEDGQYLVFRTGHGRLQWRALRLLTEEPMTIDWISNFTDNDIFFDIGANVGNYSLFASKRGVRTYAIEAEDLNSSLLYENIFLNHLEETCTPLNIAVGKNTGIASFYLKSVSKGDALHSIGRKSYYNPGVVSHRIDKMVFSLDDLIEVFKLPKPTRIKIDVDGNELQIIEGAIKTLTSVKDICIELDTNQDEHQRVFVLLEKNGFRVHESEQISLAWTPSISNYIFRRDSQS